MLVNELGNDRRRTLSDTEGPAGRPGKFALTLLYGDSFCEQWVSKAISEKVQERTSELVLGIVRIEGRCAYCGWGALAEGCGLRRFVVELEPDSCWGK